MDGKISYAKRIPTPILEDPHPFERRHESASENSSRMSRRQYAIRTRLWVGDKLLSCAGAPEKVRDVARGAAVHHDVIVLGERNFGLDINFKAEFSGDSITLQAYIDGFVKWEGLEVHGWGLPKVHVSVSLKVFEL
jgi:hypothetical protein